ncbi:MAG: hypothetical protein FWD83_07935 [Promicromonosporaceae bacterium]|nr:hypothetical protein [Promicromonosporaceae bacterium]
MLDALAARFAAALPFADPTPTPTEIGQPISTPTAMDFFVEFGIIGLSLVTVVIMGYLFFRKSPAEKAIAKQQARTGIKKPRK